MLRKSFLAVSMILVVAATSQAAIMLQATSTPLPMGNLVSWQVNAVGTAGEVVGAFGQPTIQAAVGGAGTHNVWTALLNAHTPVPQAAGPTWAPEYTAYDTFFKFDGAADLALNLGTPLEESNDNATTGTLGLPLLFAASPMSGFGQQTSGADTGKVLVPGKTGTNVNFYQVVLKAGERAVMNVDVGFTPVGGAADTALLRGFEIGGGGVVVPPNIVLTALGERELSAGLITSALNATGDPTITWSALTQTGGPPAANLATLGGTNNGTFNWNPAGSLAGKKGSGNVLYSWTATATNDGGPDTDVAISVILIPEPATISLLGLAMVAFVGVIRRRG